MMMVQIGDALCGFPFTVKCLNGVCHQLKKTSSVWFVGQLVSCSGRLLRFESLWSK